MKIREAKSIYAAQLDALWNRKRELTKILEENSENGSDDPRLDKIELSKELSQELSRELSQVEKQYTQTQKFMEQLSQRETLVHNAEVAKQQEESMSKAMDDMVKCMEIARRISSGAKVPAADQKKLMEYNYEMFLAAKNMALMIRHKERKEYDSLVEEEENPEDQRTASEIAGDSEVHMELPELAAQEISSETE